ncbi:wd-40 repeat protein [Cystoisospora suis]|uniref:Mitochondrial pyruvate carrier n=1 Tax=Cystoisospora suis TaxID=483139 RepID=A0A2C6KYX3_9APIC|nr:wd-40 repeat protein [Cystoisospora suis]
MSGLVHKMFFPGVAPFLQAKALQMPFPEKFKTILAHPAGPFAIHFWAPALKWGICIANLVDMKKQKIENTSVPQQLGSCCGNRADLVSVQHGDYSEKLEFVLSQHGHGHHGDHAAIPRLHVPDGGERKAEPATRAKQPSGSSQCEARRQRAGSAPMTTAASLACV